MFVFVEDAADTLAFPYVEVGYLRRVSERDGQRPERTSVGDALVRPVTVVELLELSMPGSHRRSRT
ncbi:hypothetical protein [Streptomyces sp. NBC_00063]|uniref:hypothetical protein n=1 Tax=Streptomyces sp. NBC_00063 TaxID=2975638 RepID=UPI00224F5DEA|nr:hypothetical protein [Streptomyces sp. NBC_00063]MCX5440890.1 hypothetical protein [Streptomyces sp. NBC_00063]